MVVVFRPKHAYATKNIEHTGTGRDRHDRGTVNRCWVPEINSSSVWPRKHAGPLLSDASAASEAIATLKGDGEYVLSTDGGETRLSAMTLSNWSKEVVGKAIENFQLKRVRSGVETVLASAQVSDEVRAHLQSHGLSGVQIRNYNDYKYMSEKRAALEVLFKLLEGKPIQRHAKYSK